MSAYKWLGRRLAPLGPFLTLCLSEAEFRAALKELRIDNPPPYRPDGSGDARTYTFTKGRTTVCIVCLYEHEKYPAWAVAALLVHEAVHVWQTYCEDLGERDPGHEQEAYAIQHISEQLFQEYARRKRRKK